MSKFIDLTEQKFNRLLVIKREENDRFGKTRWLCRCDCGNEKIINGNSLVSGSSKSCGCLNTEKIQLRNIKNKHGETHGCSGTKTYRAWGSMIQRCTNSKHIGYKNYGGRDKPITVCDRWNPKKGGSFENFLKDIGEIPKGLTFDRIDNNGDYSLDNWRLATRSVQAKNRRTNIKIDRLCLKDYCKIKNLNYSTIRGRIRNGMSLEKALNIPIRKRNKLRIDLKGNLIMQDDLKSISEELDKFDAQKAEAFVKKVGPPGKEWCVVSERTGKKLACYPTKKEAEDRLEFIKRFAK
jgi:hypothetical protein